MAGEQLQGLGHIRVVFEAVVDHDLPAVVPQGFKREALVQANPGHLVVAYRDKQIGRVQHLVVFQVVQQGIGYGAGLGGQKHGGAFHPHRRANKHGLQKTGQVHGISAYFGVEQGASVFPGQHQGEDDAANGQWEPAAVKQLHEVGGPERQVHHKEETGGAQTQGQRVFPAIANDVKRQHGGDQHVGAHRNAVSSGQVA